MEALLAFLPTSLPQALGCVVHVGAGTTGLSQAASLPVQRLVLIEGEAQVCAELERAARGLAVEVLNMVVAPKSGPVTWYRHSPSLLNGTLSAEAWRKHYPRLRVVETHAREAQALGDVLERLNLQREAGRSHVLLMDLPGQEAGLLESVAPALLDRFDWIVVRGSLPASDLVAAMRAACFAAATSATSEAALDPLWPVTLWRFDPQLREHQRLEAALERLRAECRASEEAREQQAAFAQAARASAATLEVEVQTLRTRVRDLDTQCRQLQEARLNLTSQLADARAQHEAAQASAATRLDAAAKELAQRNAELEQLTSRLSAERAQRDAKIDATAASLDDVERLLRQREAELEAVRAESARAAQEAQALEARLQELAARQADAQAQRDAADRESAAAAARLNDVERLFSQREAELATRSEQLSVTETRLAEALSANGTLERELKALRGERDAARAESAQAARDAQAREARLQDELSQMTLRQRLLDDEIVKAEGQLELIKDVLLREPSL